MKTFKDLVLTKDKKYFERFYPGLLAENTALAGQYEGLFETAGLHTLLPQHSLVLDVGSGTGIHIPLLERFGRVCALEKEFALVKDMEAYFKPRGVNAFITGEAEHLPFPAERFDFAFVNDALIHFDDQPLALKEIRRVLKKGGMAMFVEPNIFNIPVMLTLLFFENGRRIFGRHKAATVAMIKRHFEVIRILPFNCFYTRSLRTAPVMAVCDRVTRSGALSLCSFRYVVVARKGSS